MTDVSRALGEGESVRERLPLRTGGSVVLTDDRLLVVTDASSAGDPDADDGASVTPGDADVTSVALDDVAEVTIEQFDYFLGVLSALLVGYGLYSIPRSALLGIAFAGFGALSLYWTYRKRGKTRIKVAGRAKPLSVFPADTSAFESALEPLLAVDDGESGPDEADQSRRDRST